MIFSGRVCGVAVTNMTRRLVTGATSNDRQMSLRPRFFFSPNLTWGFAALLVTLGASAALSCAEPDPNFGDPGGILGRKLPGEGASTGTTSSGGGVFGAPYSATANPATTTLEAAHAAKGMPNPEAAATLDCLSCHKSGGAASTKAFTFGGRVYDPDGKAPVAAADCIVVLGDGTAKLGPVKSDKDGYFWLLGGVMPAGAHVTLRSKDNKEAPMNGPLQATDGACQAGGTCHGGTQGKIRLQ